MIRSAGDVGMFMKRTLLYIQQPNTCLDSAEGALRTLQVIFKRFQGQVFNALLLFHGFQRKVMKLIQGPLQERNFLTRKDGAIVTTAFGKAVYKSK